MSTDEPAAPNTYYSYLPKRGSFTPPNATLIVGRGGVSWSNAKLSRHNSSELSLAAVNLGGEKNQLRQPTVVCTKIGRIM